MSRNLKVVILLAVLMASCSRVASVNYTAKNERGMQTRIIEEEMLEIRPEDSLNYNLWKFTVTYNNTDGSKHQTDWILPNTTDTANQFGAVYIDKDEFKLSLRPADTYAVKNGQVGIYHEGNLFIYKHSELFTTAKNLKPIDSIGINYWDDPEDLHESNYILVNDAFCNTTNMDFLVGTHLQYMANENLNLHGWDTAYGKLVVDSTGSGKRYIFVQQ